LHICTRIGRKLRILRLRLGWRQQDLAERAGVSRATVSQAETDPARSVSLRALQQIADALGARLTLDVQWRGAELDRLLDAHHAALVELVGAFLRRHGWDVRVEVSFNHYGDRGRYDMLAFHGMARLVLVIEVKTAFGDLQDTIGRLDVKMRVAATVVRPLGWRPAAFVPVLVLAEDTTARRTVRDHPTLFARFTERGRSGLSWIQSPDHQAVPSGVLLFRQLSNARQAGVIRVRRVSRRRALTMPSPGDSTPTLPG
jgi:transcriptional regulator with XRE-family HTH domain